MKKQSTQQEIEALKARLAEAEETLRAIRCGEVDALIVHKPEGQQIYTLEGVEKPHRLLVEAMNEGAMTLNAAGTILYCNARLAEMAKRPLEQVMGSSWRQLLPPSEHSSFEALLERVKKKGAQGENALMTKEGKLLPVHVSASRVNLVGTDVFAILLTDISRLKTAEEALHQANARLEKRVQQRTRELTQANEALKAQAETVTFTNTELQAQSEALRAANEELQSQSEELQSQSEELRVQADEVRESEQRFRSLFEHAQDAVFLTVPDGRVMAANPAACAMFGMSEQELCRAGRDGIIDPHEYRLAVALHERTRTGRFRGELTCIRKNGTKFEADVSSVIVDSEQPRSFVIVRDISERKRVEREREQMLDEQRRQKEFFEKLFANASMGVAVVGKDLRYVLANPAYHAIPGTSAGSMTGRTIAEVFPPAAAQAVEGYVRKVFQSGEPLHIWEYDIVIDGRRTCLNVSEVPLRDAAGGVEAVLILTQEMTERKLAEEVLARSKEELERLVAERTAELQEMIGELEHFSYTITHDMRAPLRAMQGFGSMLLDECGDCLHAERRDLLRRIAASAGRMDSLITDALQYSKVVRQEIEVEPIDPEALLHTMVESYPQFQPPKAEIRIERNIPRVLGNEAGLTQCFSNLLNNAVKFVHPDTVPKVRVRGETRGEKVRLWFEDNGIGIAERHHDQIFDMFQTLSKSYEGTGIGLALVRKVVERMKGKVGVESEEGKGSRFWIELKRCD